MVHSIELLFDADTEAAIRRVWETLSEAGFRAPAPASRPHATLVVANGISPDVDALLTPALARLPIPCVIGAPVVFGRSPFILVRLLVPSTQLLELQAEVAGICLPYVSPAAMPNTAVGQWTPHVTMARRVEPSQLARGLRIRSMTRDIHGSIAGLRRWDGNTRVEHLI